MRYYSFVVVTCRKKRKKRVSCVILRFIITKYYHRILNTANLYRQYKRRASIPYENGVSKSFEKKNDNILTGSFMFYLGLRMYVSASGWLRRYFRLELVSKFKRPYFIGQNVCALAII